MGNPRPELVIGAAGPIGTDLDGVCGALERSLKTVGYTSEKIVLSELLQRIQGLVAMKAGGSKMFRAEALMDAGDELRRRARGDALAIMAVDRIRASRKGETGDYKKPRHNHAYLLKSLKHKKEVDALRRIYGGNFLLVSAFMSKKQRTALLSDKLGDRAKDLISRDYHDESRELGQDVRGAFPNGDAFVDASTRDDMAQQLERFTRLIFRHPFRTPSVEEYGMFLAFASSLRSSSLARQVGASILDSAGGVVYTGFNEVPKSQGGVYLEGDEGDAREFQIGHDSNQIMKRRMLEDMLARLSRIGWMAGEHAGKSPAELVDAALAPDKLGGMKFMGLTEFGREVHAEMAALVGAARAGRPVQDCDMYCTTFPCHICAKHIVASGIRRLVFIEPYPKSHAEDLFSDSISAGDEDPNKTLFEPYLGVSPRLYSSLFVAKDRKEPVTGKALRWNAADSAPALGTAETYLDAEAAAVMGLIGRMQKHGLW